ncbi:MAG: hypothetical protein IKF78_02060 [Atopobiaceae bacterium]|nr:hypothetical protein [Atopobiaceae bacterium]
MAEFDFGEGVRKFFLVGVGAIATGAEKSQQIIDDLVKKGELTMEQGKEFNDELSRKAAKAATDAEDGFLRMRMETMSPEERANYAKKVSEIVADIEKRGTTVEAEVEVVEDEDEAEAEVKAEQEASEAADE